MDAWLSRHDFGSRKNVNDAVYLQCWLDGITSTSLVAAPLGPRRVSASVAGGCRCGV